MTVRRRRKAAGEVETPRGDSKQTELRVVPPPEDDARLSAPEPDDDEPDEPAVQEPSDDPFVNEVPVDEPPPAAAAGAKDKPAEPVATKFALRVPGAWGNVVHDVFKIDIDKTFERLTKELSLGSNVTEYGHVLSALEASSRNAFDAARLVRAAKRADDDFAVDVDQRMEKLRSTARTELEVEKAAQKEKGGATKAPTLQEVSDRVLFNWPDEVRQLNRNKGEMHGAFRAIEGLEKAWWDRCQTLRKIADRFTARS